MERPLPQFSLQWLASIEADVEDSLENVEQAFQQLGPKQLSFQAGILAPPVCLESP